MAGIAFCSLLSRLCFCDDSISATRANKPGMRTHSVNDGGFRANPSEPMSVFRFRALSSFLLQYEAVSKRILMLWSVRERDGRCDCGKGERRQLSI